MGQPRASPRGRKRGFVRSSDFAWSPPRGFRLTLSFVDVHEWPAITMDFPRGERIMPSLAGCPNQRLVENMLDTDQLHKHIRALDKGDEAALRQAIHSLRQVEQQEWVAMPVGVFHGVVVALQNQILNKMKPPSTLREIATILGNMGPRAKSAVPQLVELLQDGIPD